MANSTNNHTVATRNLEIESLMEGFFTEKAVASENINADLDLVFSTPVWGFREVLLVITLARILNLKYKPTTNFYDCNPRALYEGPIRQVLAKYHIPHRKSGPLNIAKATVGINDQWAAQRRPAEVAMAVVKLTKQIERYSKEELRKFGGVLAQKFLQEASRVADLVINTDPSTDPVFLSILCKGLIDTVPDAGNTPQRICGLLLDIYHRNYGIIKVTGHEDRASVTSTTSKKPGDINEETPDGKVLTVYEVTVKPFNLPRITESYQTVKAYIENAKDVIQEVQVICRRADAAEAVPDPSQTDALIGKVEYQDLTYYFIDIYQWIVFNLLRMPVPARVEFFAKLGEYIAHPNTAEKVKIYWKQCFTEQSET